MVFELFCSEKTDDVPNALENFFFNLNIVPNLETTMCLAPAFLWKCLALVIMGEHMTI